MKIKDTLGKNKVILKGQCEPQTGEVFLLLEERIKGNDLFIPRDIKIPCSVKRDSFTAEIDLSLLSKLQNSLDLWDCYLLMGGNNKEPIGIQTGTKALESHALPTGSLMITFYGNTRHTLSISVKKNDTVAALLRQLLKNDDIYNLSGNLTGTDSHWTPAAFLSIRKRDNKNSILYSSETNFPIDLNADYSWTVRLDKQLIFPDTSIHHEEVWDLFIKLESSSDGDSLYLPLMDKATVKDDYSVLSANTFYQAKWYTNRKNCVGLWVKRIPEFLNLKSCAFDHEGQLILSCANNKDREIVDARIEPDEEIWADRFRGFSLEGTIDHDLSSFSLAFSISQLKNLYKVDKGIQFRIMIQIQNSKTNALTWMPLFIGNEQQIEASRMALSDELDAVVKGMPHEPLKIMIVNHVGANLFRKSPVRLAILGTCYTRGAFDSNPYFNPGYKSKYNIVYTQFHSSIASLMSKPVHFPETLFKDRKTIEKAYIACDFEKLFFTELSEANADYFLLDLYPDAVRDLVVFDDQHLITGSFYLRNRTFLQSLQGKMHFVSHDEEETFLQYWRAAADRFSEKIVQLFPQERIILQKARMTNSYYDKNHQVHYFSDQLDLVKRSNMFFRFMESYLLKRLPHIHTIDLNQYGYIGQYNHPYGQSTNHYEPAYYKKLIQKLDQVILEQDQRENK